MAQFGYLKNFASLHELAGILNKEDLAVFMTDIVAPYRTDLRDTRGFKATQLKAPYELSYSALLKENRVGIMANHVAFDARGNARATKGVELTEGTIPHIAAHRDLSREDYLKVAKALHDAELAGVSVKTAAQEQVLDVITGQENGMLNEHDNRVTYMRGQVVSTGKYTVTVENNDGSFTMPEFDFKVPAENKTTLTTTNRWWTNADRSTEGSTSNPMNDLRALIRKALKKNIKKSEMIFEVDYYTLIDTVNHSKVRLELGKIAFPQYVAGGVSDEEIAASMAGYSDEALIAMLETNLGVKFEVSDAIVGVEQLNKTKGILETKSLLAFNENVFVLRRKGDIGEIHAAGHVAVATDATYATYNNGGILMTYMTDARSRSQSWDTEETILLVPTDVKHMFYCNVV